MIGKASQWASFMNFKGPKQNPNLFKTNNTNNKDNPAESLQLLFLEIF